MSIGVGVPVRELAILCRQSRACVSPHCRRSAVERETRAKAQMGGIRGRHRSERNTVRFACKYLNGDLVHLVVWCTCFAQHASTRASDTGQAGAPARSCHIHMSAAASPGRGRLGQGKRAPRAGASRLSNTRRRRARITPPILPRPRRRFASRDPRPAPAVE